MSHWQFYYPKRLSFYPPDLADPGLGGAEAALVLLTQQLARRGHAVEVLNCCYRPGWYEGVRWRQISEKASAPNSAYVVAVRFEEAICGPDAPDALSAYWMLDDRTGGARAFRDRSGAEAPIVIASEAMRRRLMAAGIGGRISTIPNPVDTCVYSLDVPRRKTCLFASMPNRGLDVVLKIWPSIRSLVVDAELLIVSGWKLWGYTEAEAAARWDEFLASAPIPRGAHLLRTVPRGELQRYQRTSWLNLYPCRFPEMFCMSVAECAAAGTPTVTSAIEALEERVVDGETGFLNQGNIDTPRVQEAFIEATARLLLDAPLRAAMSAAARRDASRYDVDNVAALWELTVQQA
jgi:glycosyltransferase involved in cell wall biosynthesis